jgi:lysophospholipase L1-like esterase
MSTNHGGGSAGRRGWGVFVLRLILLLAATGISVACAEFAARIWFRSARTSGNARAYVGRQPDAWSPGPSNSLGFREREIPPKTAGRERIVVVGDSFTWGQGIERSERFSNLLEANLGARYEVFNFGRPGDDMPEHLDVLEQALQVSPNFVVLQLYINDFETSGMRRPHAHPLLPAGLDARLQESSILYDLLSGAWTHVQEATGLSEGYVHYMERSLRDQNGLNSRKAFGQLRQFLERTHGVGIPVGVVLFPATDALGPNGKTYPFAYLHDRVKQTCADEHVLYLDLLPMYSTFRNPSATWVSPFDAHPNAIANRRAAFEILAAFGSAWQR